MAMILNRKDEMNDELSRRINADLKKKMSESAKIENEKVDFSEDIAYTKDLKKTGRFAWVWILAVLAIVILTIVLGLT